MTPKRRKLVTATKPSTDPNKLLTDSLKQAISKAGLSSHPTTGPSSSRMSSDEVVRSIVGDATTQSSYRERLRKEVKDKTEKDVDYDPERFPNCSKFVDNN